MEKVTLKGVATFKNEQQKEIRISGIVMDEAVTEAMKFVQDNDNADSIKLDINPSKS